MRFASLHQERLLSLTACTSPVTFDAHHTESADLIDREGMRAWVANTIGRRLDPELVKPSQIRWYAEQMAATPAHVVSGFQRQAPGGDFRGAAGCFPNGRLVVFPGVSGFVQHILPGPCARAWLAFASEVASAAVLPRA